MTKGKLPKIKEAEINKYFEELDELRPSEDLLTDEQYECLKHARKKENPVPWRILIRWWEGKGWGRMPISTLKNRYYNMKEKKEVYRPPIGVITKTNKHMTT